MENGVDLNHSCSLAVFLLSLKTHTRKSFAGVIMLTNMRNCQYLVMQFIIFEVIHQDCWLIVLVARFKVGKLLQYWMKLLKCIYGNPQQVCVWAMVIE